MVIGTGAVLMPMRDLHSRPQELDRDNDLIVHRRSACAVSATLWLRTQGFVRVRNLTGGILEWIDKVDPSRPKY